LIPAETRRFAVSADSKEDSKPQATAGERNECGFGDTRQFCAKSAEVIEKEEDVLRSGNAKSAQIVEKKGTLFCRE